MKRKSKWTLDDWRAWRAENMRLTLEGWTLVWNGDDDYAEKDGKRIDRTPDYDIDDDGNKIAPVT
jgi:hypothetical protein